MDRPEWSQKLTDKMTMLSTKQRSAIARIVLAEAEGLPLSRMLKTAYSCQWCGQVQGRSTDKAKARKLLLAGHESWCERGPAKGLDDESSVRGTPWQFAANASTFYSNKKWGAYFRECLDAARQEVVAAALDEATKILHLGTPDAAAELRRQVRAGEKDFDRRSAAVAILDRADRTTANKARDQMAEWLADLRSDDSE